MKTTILLVALLLGGALLAVAPAATAADYERCYGDASSVEICHTKDLTMPDCLVGVHTGVHAVNRDVCWM